MKKRIDFKDAEEFYEIFSTPHHVIGHCHAVAMVSVKIGSELNKHGYNFNLSLVRGAGLVHDMARTSKDHGRVGADYLRSRGYEEEADIVRIHMYYSPFNKVDKLTETDLICLADKLVKEDRYVGVDERFRYILNKAPKDPAIQARIMKSHNMAAELIKEIESIIGKTMDQLFTGENTDE